ncbi:MAG: hypothetical protein IPG96_21600 [Proteobacteria bacterium]|nr:hypothetical protein [Pseudomonadota bacterium]
MSILPTASRSMAGAGEVDRRWFDSGTVLHPAANCPVQDDRDAALRMQDPADASYFPLLLHAVERYVRSPRPELRPLLVMFAAGGGTDVATTTALAMWHLQGLAAHPWLADTDAHVRGGATWDYRRFLAKDTPLDVAIVSTAETKLGHQDAAYPDQATKETLAYHHGSLIPGANLPWSLVGGRPVTAADEHGRAVVLQSLRGVAADGRFTRRVELPFGRSELIVGRPLVDVQLLPLIRRLVPLTDLFHFGLDGHDLHQARREMALLLRHLARRGVPCDKGELVRPLFLMVTDPGGDTIVKRGSWPPAEPQRERGQRGVRDLRSRAAAARRAHRRSAVDAKQGLAGARTLQCRPGEHCRGRATHAGRVFARRWHRAHAPLDCAGGARTFLRRERTGSAAAG